MAMTFDHREALQERAFNAVARHLKTADESVSPELRTAAGRLRPGSRYGRADLLGASVPRDSITEHVTDHVTEQVADELPVLTGPRPVPGPLETSSTPCPPRPDRTGRGTGAGRAQETAR
jgi:hypothetical protein